MTTTDAAARSSRARTASIAAGAGAVLLFSSYRCPFHAVTGWYCPGCGGTRALFDLLHGDIAGAWRDNAFALTVVPVALLLSVFGSSRAGRALTRHQRVVIPLAVLLTLAFTIARNTVAPGLAPL